MTMHANHLSNGWSEERVEFARQLWRSGNSASMIAKEIGGGLSRNAVIGKMHRIGEAKRVSPVRFYKGNGHAVKKRRRKRQTESYVSIKAPSFQAVAAALPPEPPTPDTLVSLEDIEPNQCRFPFGDPKTKDFGFCGCETVVGSSYCAGHHAVCWAAETPKRRKWQEQPSPAHNFAHFRNKEVAF
jgi:GcrA cell cycle regulator